jgi:hypothetical protein
MRATIYLPESQFNAMKAMAREQKVSLSRLVRGAFSDHETVRGYTRDGEHTREARLEAEILRILRGSVAR